MLVLDNFGSVLLTFGLNKLDKFVQSNPNLQPQAKKEISETIRTLKAILPFLERCHRALFYCGGLYYQISKRFTSIQYKPMPYDSPVHTEQYQLRQHKSLQELHPSTYKLKNEIGIIRTRIGKETDTIFSVHGRKDGKGILQERLTGHKLSSRTQEVGQRESMEKSTFT
ncbi:hypothetical protein J6590_102297 [Homalodisca vitripennis]|nr:hypothetical protein J6590_102297 [Homalodisca vitripennis]